MKRVLITGISGFAGSHLAEDLAGRCEVWGTYLEDDLTNLSGVQGVRLLKFDLLDYKGVSEAVSKARPDAVFHLAAVSAPSYSFTHPGETLNVNIFSTLNILEAVSAHAPGAVVVNVGSGDEYGEADEKELPVKETAQFRPVNPYAVSKVTQDLLGFQYWKSKGVKVIRCRPFNHFGPRQSEAFVASAFAKQVAEVEAGLTREKAIKTGNLEAAKDFLYVKDVVSAYVLLSERGEPGEAYNICSGSVVKIREIAERLVGLSTEKISIVEDTGRKRPTDARLLYGSNEKIKRLGWERRYGLDEGLRALLDFWRKRIAR